MLYEVITLGNTAWQDCNVNDLTDLNRYDAISGFPVYKALLCEVVRADGVESAEERLHRRRAGQPHDRVGEVVADQRQDATGHRDPGQLPGGADREPVVITSYSIHYTKLYDCGRPGR